MNLNILKLLLSLVKYNTICKHFHKYFLITTKQQKPLGFNALYPISSKFELEIVVNRNCRFKHSFFFLKNLINNIMTNFVLYFQTI